ncbi:MAG: SH3 domain-containing protein [Candidatus Dormibacteria bacterium]
MARAAAGWHRRRLALALLCAALAACAPPAATGVATNAPGSGAPTTAAAATPAPVAGGVRTVLAPLGLNLHAAPQLTAPVVGTAAIGTELLVLAYQASGGGWYQVRGQTTTGWIVSDPTLSAPGHFTQYTSDARQFSAYYPQAWTFAEQPAQVVFYPLDGPQSIVVRNAAHVSDFGALGASGYSGNGQQTVVVCGITGQIDLFQRPVGTPGPSPAPGTAAPLPLLAQLRLRLDSTHALAVDFNYTSPHDLDAFSDFYNSMTFPFPACESTPSPSPT